MSRPASPAVSTQVPALAFADEEPLAEVEVAVTQAPTTTSSSTTTTTPAPKPRPEQILLVGDSIAHEARAPLTARLATKDIELTTVTFPGLAPCDLLEAASISATDTPPDVVVLLFTGNAISPCMSNANDPGSPEYFAAYERDMTAMVDVVTAAGADVWTVEPLRYNNDATNETVAGLNDIFLAIDGVDGAIPVVDLFTTDQGAFSAELPCVLPDEPCPTVRVRASDETHLGDDGTDNLFGRDRMAFAIDRFIEARYQ